MVGPFFTLLSFEFFTLSPFPLSFERGFRFKKIRIERYDRSRSIDRDNYSINSIQLISSFDFRSNDIVINVCEYILVDCWSLWITRLFRTKISKMDKKIFRKVWRNRSSSNKKKKKKKKKEKDRFTYRFLQDHIISLAIILIDRSVFSILLSTAYTKLKIGISIVQSCRVSATVTRLLDDGNKGDKIGRNAGFRETKDASVG